MCGRRDGGGRHLSCYSRAATVVVSPKSLLEMQTLGPHPRPTEEGALGAGPRTLHFNAVSSSGDLGANWQGLVGMQQRSWFRSCWVGGVGLLKGLCVGKFDQRCVQEEESIYQAGEEKPEMEKPVGQGPGALPWESDLGPGLRQMHRAPAPSQSQVHHFLLPIPASLPVWESNREDELVGWGFCYKIAQIGWHKQQQFNFSQL